MLQKSLLWGNFTLLKGLGERGLHLPDSLAASHAIFHLAVSAEMKSNSHCLYRQQTDLNVYFGLLFNLTKRIGCSKVRSTGGRKHINQDKSILQKDSKSCCFFRVKKAETRCVIAIKESLGLNYTDLGCLLHLGAVVHWQKRPLEPKFKPI